MALLCGCDYNDGVQGIGKESVLKFFEKVSDEEVINRIKTWRNKPDLYEEYESRISDKQICKSCGHPGKIGVHTKNGNILICFIVYLQIILQIFSNSTGC